MSAMGAGARAHGDVVAEEPADDEVIEGAIDSMDTGVLLLNHEQRVTYANARWATWRGVAIPVGASFPSLVELAAGESLLELKATLTDGEPRSFHFVLRPAHADSPSRLLA